MNDLKLEGHIAKLKKDRKPDFCSIMALAIWNNANESERNQINQEIDRIKKNQSDFFESFTQMTIEL